MNEEFVTFIVKSEVKIDHFVQGKIFKSAASWNDDIRHFGIGNKRSIILVLLGASEFRINDVQLILKQKLIKNQLHLDGIKKHAFFLMTLYSIYCLKNQMIALYKIFLFKNILICLFEKTLVESFIVFQVFILNHDWLNIRFVVMIAVFLCFYDDFGLFNFDVNVHKKRIDQFFDDLFIFTEKYFYWFLHYLLLLLPSELLHQILIYG